MSKSAERTAEVFFDTEAKTKRECEGGVRQADAQLIGVIARCLKTENGLKVVFYSALYLLTLCVKERSLTKCNFIWVLQTVPQTVCSTVWVTVPT